MDGCENLSMNPDNQVYHEKNLTILHHLDDNIIDLTYIDPPFYSGNDYGEFNDNWPDLISYLSYMYPRIKEIHRTLKDTGSFYLHCDHSAGSYLKILCDFIFEIKNFMTAIPWSLGSPSGFKTQKKGWVRQHDMILVYTKSKDFTFNKLYLPYNDKYIKKMFRYEDENGRLYRKRRNGKQYLDESLGVLIGDIWFDILSFQTRTNAKEYVNYPTQKPLALLERIIQASSNKGDLVADFFCGTGTTLVAAKKLGRNYLGCDKNRNAIEITTKRLEAID